MYVSKSNILHNCLTEQYLEIVFYGDKTQLYLWIPYDRVFLLQLSHHYKL